MSVISIIVPIHNAERWIMRCLSSIETVEEAEVWLVDDGSTDDSLRYIKAWAQTHEEAQVICTTHRGVAAARNAALERASGEYVLFLDSDDYIAGERLSVLCAYAEQNRVDILRFALCYEKDGRRRWETPPFPLEKKVEKEDFCRLIYPCFWRGIYLNSVCHTLYQREVIEGLRFSEQMATAEDLVFSMAAFSRADSFFYTDRVVYHYCPSGGGLTGRGVNIAEKYACNRRAGRIMMAHLPEWHMDTASARLAVYGRFVRILLSKIGRRWG